MITIVGDPHCKPDNLDKINTLFDMVEDLGNDVIWLGDLLDTKEVVRSKCLNLYLKRFHDSHLRHIVLCGNHDWHNLACEDHSLQPLKGIENVTVVDSPMTIGLEGVLCRFYPYLHDLDALIADLKAHPAKPVFGHFEIVGRDFGNGHIAESGLTPEDFSNAARVISGHFHKYSDQDNILYLGTPFSHSFGESNQDKFIGLFNPKTLEMELIPTPFPRHMTTEVDCAKDKTCEINPDDINRVILTGTQEQINKFKKQEGVRYIERPSNTAEESVVVSEADTPETQFQKWATEIKGYSKEVVQIGLEVLRNV